MSKQDSKNKGKSTKNSTRQKIEKTGDRITAKDIGDNSAIAQGQNARAYIVRFGNISIDLRLFPVVVLLLVIISVLIYLVVPKHPQTMTGEFNVAVAELVTLNKLGQPVKSEDSRNLSKFLYERLTANLSELDLRTVRYEIWPPEYTGVITGSSEQERWKHAEATADSENGISADMIIYGVITESNFDSNFANLTLEFYVNYQGFEQAEEITGEHQMGKPVQLKLPFREDELIDVTNRLLSERANALSLITIGLAYYSIDDYEKAIKYFSQAENTAGWLSSDGKEVVYLLLGNAMSRLSSRNETTDGLTTALEFYDQALKINEDYARATVGRAGVLYLLTIGDPNNSRLDSVDQVKLDEVEAEFEKALSQKYSPESANIESKVNFGLGQVFLIRYLTNQGDDWQEKAREKFELVVQEYDTGNWRITDLAGHAHARLGLIAALQNKTPIAIEEYMKAIELVTPYYQAYYYTRLGKIYADSYQIDAAVEAYQQAVNIAESHADVHSSERYRVCLQELKTSSVLEDCESR